MLAGIKRALLSPKAIEEICHGVRAALRGPKPRAPDNRTRISQLKDEISNLVEAIAVGELRASPAVAVRLAAAEAELAQLEAPRAVAAPAADVSLLLADLPARAVRAVEQLEQTLASGDIAGARQDIRDKVGVVTVEADAREIRLYSERGNVAAALLRASGSHASLYGSGGRMSSFPSGRSRHRVK